MAMAYTFHVGSDKNRKLSSKGLTTPSGTTSLSNNGIQNKAQLTRSDKHNYRLYDNNQEQIEIIRGTNSIVKDVKDLYHDEFDGLVLEYNNHQRRSDRKIDDYFEHVSKDKTRDLAVEIIIELGDKEFWDTKDEKYKRKMSGVYKKQINDLKLLLPEFKVCSGVVHYDETSPHLHLIGVPIKDGYKNGLSSQVCKSQVFNKTKLMELQDKMRTLCIQDYNEKYNLNETLKKKQKGRNRDINVKDMDHYAEAKIAMELEEDKLDKINKESIDLDNKTNKVSNKLKTLKQNPITKNYSLSQEEKQNIENYITQVREQNQKYKEINNLKNIINDGYNNMKKLKNVNDENKALNIKLKALENKVKDKDKTIDNLKNENFSLKSELNKFKEKFKKLFKFLIDKMFSRERESYWEVSKNLYHHDILGEDEIYTIKDKRDWNIQEDKSRDKEKDDEGLGF